jgi:hypothetical protein
MPLRGLSAIMDKITEKNINNVILCTVCAAEHGPIIGPCSRGYAYNLFYS